MDLLNTLNGSMLESFFPQGWDLKKMDDCCSLTPKNALDKRYFWNQKFLPVGCENISSFDMMMGHEIALTIKKAKDNDQIMALILPVGPMGMYRWAVYFLKEWNVDLKHVVCFNMDEWSDCEGNTLNANDPGAFQNAMINAFYGPLGKLTAPENHRNFATKENIASYPEKIGELKAKGALLVTVYGIGRMMHIAFWEPHFAGEFKNLEQWKEQPYRRGAKLHPLTIEQNAITSFKSRTTLVPCYANTIGPALFLKSDYAIGGCDGILGRGMQWQGFSLCVTLCYGPDMWVPSSFMPTIPGKLFYINELMGPLVAECN